jgi:hypothetical protein
MPTIIGVKHLRLRDITGGVDHELFERGRVGRDVVTGVDVAKIGP